MIAHFCFQNNHVFAIVFSLFLHLVMKTKLKFILLVVFVFSFVFFYNGLANDTIRFSTSYPGVKTQGIIATPNKLFTVNWGDNSALDTYIGTGEGQDLEHKFNTGHYKVTVSGSEDCFFSLFASSALDTLDLSSCPSIVSYTHSTILSTLLSLNTRNCGKLESISVSGNKLSVLDLRDNIALKQLTCWENQLTRIDLVSIEIIACWENRLQLSELYQLGRKISNPWNKTLGRQQLPTQRIAVEDSVDFSDQNEFGGVKTVFKVWNGYELAPPETYKIEEGVITFYKSGSYKVEMTNAHDAFYSSQKPTVVVVPIKVIDFVPVAEIVDVPTTAVVGTPLNLFCIGTVLPANATYKTIVWSVKEAGTTGATITKGRLYTTGAGAGLITATITDGSAIGTPFTQDFCIEVEPLGVVGVENVRPLQVYPNPTTGELRIETLDRRYEILDIEIYDVIGKKLVSSLKSQISNQIIDISGLSAGIYFVKITTEAGEVVEKVVKQ